MDSENKPTVQSPSKANGSAKKGQKGFSKGASGNPAGRPPNSPNKMSRVAFEKLGANAEEIVMAVIEKAIAGDTAALRMCLERIAPPVRSTAVSITLPKCETPRDISKGYDALFDILARGDITLDEFLRISNVLESRRKALETAGLAEEMERLKEYVGLST